MLTRFILLTAVALIFTLTIKLRKNNAPNEEIVDEEVQQAPKKSRGWSPLVSERQPASAPEVSPETPAYRTSERNNALYDTPTSEIAEGEESEAPGETYSSNGYYTPEPDPEPTYQRRPQYEPSKVKNFRDATTSSSSPQRVIAGDNFPSNSTGSSPGGFVGSPGNTGGEDKTPVSGAGSSNVESLICSSSIGSGSYAYAFNVSLTCTGAANIKYCLSENTCCDPEVSGIDYTGSLNVNPGAGNYCLSFVGISMATGDYSPIVEKNYTFNPALPDLQVASGQKYFQTTELEGLMSFSSLDFGSPGMYAGVINLKDHDPGPTDLNWNCEEILRDHTTLSTPLTSLVMPDTDVSGYSSSSQQDVFLRTTNLVYGTNYLTTYIQNATFLEPITACSTTSFILEDFPFFDPLPYHGVDGTNSVREFSGGFTHLGFFEPEETIYRGPAGENSESVFSQKLETNLFGIFF